MNSCGSIWTTGFCQLQKKLSAMRLVSRQEQENPETM